MSLKAGDIIVVVEKHASGWFKGECNGAVGLFPSNYTEVVVEAASAVIEAASGDNIAQAKVAEMKAKRMARLQTRNSASPEIAASTIQRLVRTKSQSKVFSDADGQSSLEVAHVSKAGAFVSRSNGEHLFDASKISIIFQFFWLPLVQKSLLKFCLQKYLRLPVKFQLVPTAKIAASKGI